MNKFNKTILSDLRLMGKRLDNCWVGTCLQEMRETREPSATRIYCYIYIVEMKHDIYNRIWKFSSMSGVYGPGAKVIPVWAGQPSKGSETCQRPQGARRIFLVIYQCGRATNCSLNERLCLISYYKTWWELKSNVA